MAIKVGGTTVVDDARQLTNVTGLDAATVTAFSDAGIGGGGTIDLVASGAISNGDLVSLNSDGTVSVTTGEGLAKTVYSATEIDYQSITYDSTNQKIVISYRDDSNSNYGTAVVGTVSGSSISFGTPVVFYTGRADYTAITYDANSGKVVIAYTDDAATLTGKAVVGTVSGTSISFGSPVTFGPVYTYYTKLTYDANAQKVVLTYMDGSNADGVARVGTVSGTSISFGTAVTFADQYETPEITYDANAQKVVVVYRDASNNYATARVGTVSGTSISFGTAVVFQSAYSTGIEATYDSNAQKVVVLYNDSDNSYVGMARVGTISGTSISFGTAVAYNDAANVGENLGFTYDANAQKVVIVHRGGGTDTLVTSGTVSGSSISFGPPAVVDTTATPTRLSATYDANAQTSVLLYSQGATAYATTYNPANSVNNWIGFAGGDINNGATGSITVVSGANEGQTGLTTGAKYYLDGADASLTTTVTSGKEVGRALSTTKMFVTQGSIS